MTSTVREESLAIAAVVSMLLVSAGCPVVPSTSVETTIDFLSSSDALVGSTGKVRVELLEPASETAVIMLRSSNPAVASVPESVTIGRGSAVAEVAYQALATGVAQIEATLGESVSTTFID